MSAVLNLVATFLRTGCGTILVNMSITLWLVLTMLRAARDVPNISLPSSCAERSTLVFITFLAFLDIVIAVIMTAAAMTR